MHRKSSTVVKIWSIFGDPQYKKLWLWGFTEQWQSQDFPIAPFLLDCMHVCSRLFILWDGYAWSHDFRTDTCIMKVWDRLMFYRSSLFTLCYISGILGAVFVFVCECVSWSLLPSISPNTSCMILSMSSSKSDSDWSPMALARVPDKGSVWAFTNSLTTTVNWYCKNNRWKIIVIKKLTICFLRLWDSECSLDRPPSLPPLLGTP